MTDSMLVAVLDDYNGLADSYLPADLSATVFRDTILPSVDADALVKRLEPFHVLCTMRERTPLPRSILERLPNLRVILTTGMRNLTIDMEYCKERGIPVYGTPNPPSLSWVVPTSGLVSWGRADDSLNSPDFTATVQHTWALILSLADNIPRDHNHVLAGSWLKSMPLNAFIGGRTLGLVGLGQLGTGVARIAHQAFAMKVIAWSENLNQQKADAQARSVGLPAGSITAVSKAELFSQSDIVSIHYVLSDRSRGIVSASDLARMKRSALLVNTSRGPLVEEKALLQALKDKRIQGAAIDVFDMEPLPLDSEWRTISTHNQCVVLTPHTGYSFDHSIPHMWHCSTQNLERLLKGDPLEWRLN